MLFELKSVNCFLTQVSSFSTRGKARWMAEVTPFSVERFCGQCHFESPATYAGGHCLGKVLERSVQKQGPLDLQPNALPVELYGLDTLVSPYGCAVKAKSC